MTEVGRMATSFQLDVKPPAMPDGDGCERLLSALWGAPPPAKAAPITASTGPMTGSAAPMATARSTTAHLTTVRSTTAPPGSKPPVAGVCARGVPEKAASLLPEPVIGPADDVAPPALLEGGDGCDAISALLAALLSSPPPKAPSGQVSCADAASLLERETDGDQSYDIDLDLQHEQEDAVPTIMVDPLSWANHERVQWISADECIQLDDQACPPAEDSNLPEKPKFKHLWTQTGYPLGWASMSPKTAAILATVHTKWPL